MELLELGPEIVEPLDFCHFLAQLHETRVTPTGKFGCHQVSYQDPNPQNVTWESSWCTFSTRRLVRFYELEIAQNGPQPDYEAAYRHFAQDVVPKILEPLQPEGRVLKPSLIHGDLWEENTGLNLESGLPVVFDASVMCHNEMDLGM